MSDSDALISALATAPGVIIPLIREVPPQILKRRPAPAKWSAYEHAIHLSQSDVAFRARLDLILSTPEPFIKTIENSTEDEEGAMLDNFDHIKAYWVMLGKATAQTALHFGANDLDGTITDGGELTHAYAAEGEVKMTKQEIIEMITRAGFEAVERDTVYNRVEKIAA